MNFPEEVNAPAAAKHPRVPPPIMIVDKMTTRTFDVHDNSLYSLMQSGLFLSHQDGPYPGGSYLNYLEESLIIEIIYICIRGCQIGMQGPQLCTKPRHFCKLDVVTSRMAFLDLDLHVLQVATSNLSN